MKRFFYKGILIITSFFVILSVLNRNSDIFYYTEFKLSSKYKYLETEGKNFNTIAIGPSHVNRHFIPSVFDTKTGLRSFNLGIGGMLTLQTMYNIENIIDKDILPNLEYIIFHTDGKVLQLKENRLKLPWARYFFDFRRYQLGLKYHFHQNDYVQVSRFTYAYLYNLFSVGQIRKLLFGNPIKIYPWVPLHKGYMSYGNTAKYAQDYFRKNESYIMPESAYRSSAAKPLTTKSDQLVINEIVRIQKKAKQKNIEIILLIPPNNDFHRKVNSVDCIYAGDGADFPEFFDVRNRANKNHLNEIGANIYTQRIAEMFNKVILPN